jgi:hypothetical protein
MMWRNTDIMYVRTVSNYNGTFILSMVYAVVDGGRDSKYIVYNKWNDSFELVDYWDKTQGYWANKIYRIRKETDGFVEYENEQLLELNKYCEENNLKIPMTEFLWGYPDVCENYAFICDIIMNRVVPANRYQIQKRDIPDLKEWKYINTEEDIQEFMDFFMGFHDSKMEKLTYEESEEKGTKVNVIFDNEYWFGKVELCFEGVLDLRIAPPIDFDSSELDSATLQIDDEGFFWADEYMEKPDMTYEGSIIRALSLKWKKLEEDDANIK